MHIRPAGLQFVGTLGGVKATLSDWLPVTYGASYTTNRSTARGDAIVPGCLVAYVPNASGWDRANLADQTLTTQLRLAVCESVADTYGNPINNDYIGITDAGRIRIWEQWQCLFRISEDGDGGGGTGGVIADGAAGVWSAALCPGTISNYALGRKERTRPITNDLIYSHTSYTEAARGSTAKSFGLNLYKKESKPGAQVGTSAATEKPIWIVYIDEYYTNHSSE